MAKKANGARFLDLGLLIMRCGLGLMFVFHGWPKISGGAELWGTIGAAVSNVGIHFGFVFFGFMAACAEFFGGVFLIVGSFTRPFCVLLTITMAVASIMHLRQGDGVQVASHAIEMGVVFFSLIFIGPGSYTVSSLTGKLEKKK